MATNLETLELKISANAQEATKGLGKLISSLSVLSQRIQAPLNSLKDLNNELRALRDLSGKHFAALTKGKEQASSVGKATAAVQQQADAVKTVGKAWDTVTQSATKATETAQKVDWSQVYKKQQEQQLRSEQWLKERNENAMNAMKQRTELFLGMRMDSPNMRRYQYNINKNAIAEKGIDAVAKQYFLTADQVQQRMDQLEESVNGKTQKMATETAKAATDINKSTNEATNSTKAFAKAKDEATKAVQKSAEASELEAAKLAKVNAQADKLKAQTEKIRQQTKQVQERVSDLGNQDKSVKKLSDSFGKMLSTIGRIGKMMLIRTAIRAVLKGAKKGLDNFYQYSKKLDNGYAQSIDAVSNRWKQIKNQIGATLGTALAAVLPILEAICTAAITALNVLSALFAAIAGKSTYSQATLQAGEYQKAASGAAKANKELLASFDELNVLTDKASGGGSGKKVENFGEMFTEVQVPQWMIEWKPLIEAVLYGTLGAVILPKIWDWLKKIFDMFGGQGALNLIDILKKMFKLDGKDFSTPTDGLDKLVKKFDDPAIDDTIDKINDLDNLDLEGPTEGLNDFLDKFVDPDVVDSVKSITDLFGTIKNLDWKKLLIERLPELLKLALEVITKLVQGMDVDSKVKVDRKEFDKLKKDFDKWIKGDKDKNVNVVMNPLSLVAFNTALEALTQDAEKKINFTFSNESAEVLSMMNDILTMPQDKMITFKFDSASAATLTIVNSILTAPQDKLITFRFNSESVEAMLMINAILTAPEDKTITFKFDADSVATLTIINAILTAPQDKTISFKFDSESFQAMTIINAILSAPQDKTISFKFDAESFQAVNIINAILTAPQEKKISFKVDSESVMIFNLINDILTTTQSKTISIKPDADSVLAFRLITAVLEAEGDKYINLKFVDDGMVLQHLTDWINTEDTKVINIKFNQEENNTNPPAGTQAPQGEQKPWYEWDIADLFNNVFGTNIKTLPEYFDDWLNSEIMLKGAREAAEDIADTINAGLNSKGPEIQATAEQFAEYFENQQPVMNVKISWKKETPNDFQKDINSKTGTMNVKLAWAKTSKSNTYLEYRKNEINDFTGTMKAKIAWAKTKKTKEDFLTYRKGEIDDSTGVMNAKLAWTKGKGGLTALETKTKAINDSTGTMKSKLQWAKDKSGKEPLTGMINEINGSSATITTKANLDSKSVSDAVNTINGKTASIKVNAVLNNAADFGNSVAKAIAEKLKVNLNLKTSGGYNNWTVQTKATGGLVDSGDIFIANENGKAEMIGRFGNQTAVANQEQMVEAMARGVAYANNEQNGLLREQNSLLRAILRKEANINIEASSSLGKTVKQSLAMYGAVTG